MCLFKKTSPLTIKKKKADQCDTMGGNFSSVISSPLKKADEAIPKTDGFMLIRVDQLILFSSVSSSCINVHDVA